MCARCTEAIAIGSGAQRVYPIEDRKPNFDKVRYFHLESECPFLVKAAGKPLTERP